jgi:hypothetical protein
MNLTLIIGLTILIALPFLITNITIPILLAIEKKKKRSKTKK